MTMDFSITERALDRVRQIATEESVTPESHMLRVAVVPGGCSGLTYELGWDTTKQEGDSVFEAEEFKILVDRRSRLYMDGVALDFTDGLGGKGFHFQNPQAVRTCACGESFGL